MNVQKNGEVSSEALEDIRTKVKPILGLNDKQADEMIVKVATKHNMGVERVIRIAKNMRAREVK